MKEGEKLAGICSRQHKQRLDGLKETRGYWKVELEALCLVFTVEEDVEL
jgi:hypothetical protein